MDSFHKSVLKKEAIEFLNIRSGGVYVDATLGGGGHLAEMFNTVNDIKVIAFDIDMEAIQHTKQVRQLVDNDKIIFVNKNFSYLSSALALNNIKEIDGILFDLGISSHQISKKGRGFSFNQNERLDMRMNQNGNISAFEVVNFYPQKELARVIHEYCEDRYWKRITKKIVEERAKKPIETTFQLKKLIEEVIPRNYSIKSFARVFQAIRIEVNKELDSLKKALESVVPVLKKGGRIVVISYHSLEDRIVKNFFKYENLKCICPPKFPKCICSKEKRLEIITKHPKLPSKEEIERNPQSRSAKLRVAERC
ncbi:MAG: 16S rRNA (cytosine(1402)-N(4))-methyltransferase RsmH [Candidatus Cloacimonetes bacterium]|nr:16S rRNA (cytosine(1402)-N(4))-methyltransferase RsmH [Candidatus Cloacimonadota bacterium]